MTTKQIMLPDWVTVTQTSMDDGAPHGTCRLDLSYRGTDAAIYALPEALVDRTEEVIDAGIRKLIRTLTAPLTRRPAPGVVAPDMPNWAETIPAVRAELLAVPRRPVDVAVSDTPPADRVYSPPAPTTDGA